MQKPTPQGASQCCLVFLEYEILPISIESQEQRSKLFYSNNLNKI
jgi:hypothetical protein